MSADVLSGISEVYRLGMKVSQFLKIFKVLGVLY